MPESISPVPNRSPTVILTTLRITDPDNAAQGGAGRGPCADVNQYGDDAPQAEPAGTADAVPAGAAIGHPLAEARDNDQARVGCQMRLFAAHGQSGDAGQQHKARYQRQTPP